VCVCVFLQAIYELIMSEQSYLASLDVLVQHFMDSTLFSASVGGQPWTGQMEVIFSNVKEVRQASAEFLLSVQERQAGEGVIFVGVARTMLEFVSQEFGKESLSHKCCCVSDEEQVGLLCEVLC